MISNNLRKDVNPFDSQNVKKEEGKKSTYEK